MENDSNSLSRVSINNEMIGNFFEDNKNDDNKEITLKDEILDEEIENEEKEELSDIMKKSDYDDDDYDSYGITSDNDSKKEYDKNFHREKGNKNDSNDDTDNDEDINIVRRRETLEEIPFLEDFYGREPPFSVSIKEGFTQNVNKNIKKVINLPYYVNNEMIEVLMIAEKPSLARTIARILSNDRYISHYRGSFRIYTFKKKFQGYRNNYILCLFY